jgi:hypothetical protein
MAEKTIEKFLARAVRLYELEQEEPFGSPLLGCMCGRIAASALQQFSNPVCYPIP